MSLIVTVKTIAEYLRTDCNILGDSKKGWGKQLPARPDNCTPGKRISLHPLNRVDPQPICAQW